LWSSNHRTVQSKVKAVNSGTVIQTDRKVKCKLYYKRVCSSISFSALTETFAAFESSSILGGNPARTDAGRFSYWAAEPREVFEFRAGQRNPFEKLHGALNKYELASSAIRDMQHAGEELPKDLFCGGWIGYFSYELGRYIERLPDTTVDDLKMHLIRLCFYDRLIAYNHVEGNFWLLALHLPGDSESPEEKMATLEERLSQARRIHLSSPESCDIENIDFSQVRCNMDKDYYLRMIEKIKRYIYDGDVYQINFSQRFECDYTARPIDLFHWQNHYNPSGYAAYIDAGQFHIVSASPEMFITINDGMIQTKPIKGTRRRIFETSESNRQAKEVNVANYTELLDSEKEQAELNMIVDLERNDVARICEPGTRSVVQPRTIEAYPTVFHAVAMVGGRLRKDVTFCDVLKAMFPGGSITGAPKIRSIEIIDETEPTARAVYTGSIGYIGLDGNVSLNIAIRTIIIANQTAFAQTGGGIVADSDPQSEWDETITKARALIAGIRAVQSSKQQILNVNTKHEIRNPKQIQITKIKN
jgi:para-aminobenzoate synthetase component 1